MFCILWKSSQSRRTIIQCLATRSCSHENSSKTTIDPEEVAKFGRISQKWWNRGGEFGALHTLNHIRVPLVRDALAPGSHSACPLNGMKLLDVGCGGGILSEVNMQFDKCHIYACTLNFQPLARLGADVTGLDASEENVLMAQLHSKQDSTVEKHTRYVCSPVEQMAATTTEQFDAVVASEILEHVSDPQIFLSACCSLVKPNGSLFITSINKTQKSKALAVFAAERILRIVPEGAHDWEKFVPVDELQAMLLQDGMTVQLLHGIKLNPFSLKWSWTSDISMNYALHATKNST